MAIELSGRTKVIAGVAVVVVAVGGAGFFFFDDIMQMIDPPPPPKKVAAAPAKAAADAPKAPAEAAKTADAAKAAVASGKPAAEAPKAVADAKAAAAKKPIPSNPDQLIAEVIETSAVKSQIQNFGREVGRSANEANQTGSRKLSADEAKALYEATARIFEPQKMTAEIQATLKAAYDADKMTRFLEILRQPLALKMAAQESRQTPPEETTRLLEDIRKNPPSAQRQKVVQALDELTQSSESGVQLATLTAREMMDAMFAELQKAGKQIPKQARQFVGSRIVASQGSMRSGFRTMFYITYRDASDEELAEYVKLLDTDVGRWGLQQLANAQRTAVEARVRPFAQEVAQIAVRHSLAKGQAPVPVAAAEEEKPAEKLATAAQAPAPAAEAPTYKRAPNTREVYSRYNDLITAAVMRDKVAVKELLDDGKYPDVRQKDGVTPLMIAAANGDVETASLLLAKGADPNLRATGGKSALSLAKQRNAAPMVQLLQSKGAKE